MPQEILEFRVNLAFEAVNAGMLVSRGRGLHPERTWPRYDLIFVREGILGIQEEDQRFEVSPGQTLLLSPGRRHRGTAVYPPDLRFYWLEFMPRGVLELNKGPTLCIPQYSTLSRPDQMIGLFRRLLDDQESGDLDPVTANFLILLMLCEVTRSRPPGAPRESTADILAGRADAHIRSHFHEPLSASELGRVLGCNPNYLARVFRKVFGHTLTDAIHSRRLDHAGRRLIESDANINEIAQDCGFEDTGYFRRLFKRRQGLTPLAFRRLYARVSVNTE